METTKCKWCSAETRMMGTKECDRCWELHRCIEADIELAKRMIAAVEEKNENPEMSKMRC